MENALCLNKAYQSMLVELSQQLDILRIINQQKQKEVQEEIEMLVHKKPEKQKKRKITFSFFGKYTYINPCRHLELKSYLYDVSLKVCLTLRMLTTIVHQRMRTLR